MQVAILGIEKEEPHQKLIQYHLNMIAELVECSPIIIQNSSSPSSRRNLDVRPYNCMTVRLYKVLSSSSVVSALGSELDDLGSSPGWGKALCPWDVWEKKMWAPLLGLAKSIYYWCLLKIYIQESHIQSESSHLLHSFLNDTVLYWSIRSFNIPTSSPPPPSLGTFKDWFVQISTSWGKSCIQIPPPSFFKKRQNQWSLQPGPCRTFLFSFLTLTL